MKYISTKKIDTFLTGKSYSSCGPNGSVIGMKKLYGWNKAKEIVRSGQYCYAIW